MGVVILDLSETLLGVFKYGFDLLMRHAWKPFQKIVDALAVFEVGE